MRTLNEKVNNMILTIASLGWYENSNYMGRIISLIIWIDT